MISSVTQFVLLLCLAVGALYAESPPAIWVDVPFVKQEQNGCGAASIAMVMQYWHTQDPRAVDENIDPAQIQRDLYSRRARGIYASDAQHYFEQHGFRTFVFRGEWRQLRGHLEKGRPLIAALKPTHGGGALHYVVVVGVDSEQALVLVNDPAERKLLKRDRSDFEGEWSGAGNWTMLALPQQGSR
jgi:ABC-type bacteriocin/lantibiotic exporter with double-glycine peptidase domain